MISNVHERRLPASSPVGALIDGLASPEDELWPRDQWPPMSFDRALGVGAVGGHGPIRYTVETYVPGRHIRFRFDRPSGFDGYHEFVVVPATEDHVVLRHSLAMRTRRSARLAWPLVFAPLHDALIEDALHNAAIRLGQSERPPVWGIRVRLLRHVVRRVQRSRPTRALPGRPSRRRATARVGDRS